MTNPWAKPETGLGDISSRFDSVSPFFDETPLGECRELLRVWDSGANVTTIRMGGMGGMAYEMPIQRSMFAILRMLVEETIDASLWANPEVWRVDRDRLLETTCDGLSSTQAGGAVSLATAFYQRGHKSCLAEVSESRRIVVNT